MAGSAWGCDAARAVGKAMPWSGASKRRADCKDRPLGGGRALKSRFTMGWSATIALEALGSTAVVTAVVAVVVAVVLEALPAVAVAVVLAGAGAVVAGFLSKSMMTMPGVVPLMMPRRFSASDCVGSAAVTDWLTKASAAKQMAR